MSHRHLSTCPRMGVHLSRPSSIRQLLHFSATNCSPFLTCGDEGHVMGINPRPGILPPSRMMRTFARAMEGVGLKTPPAQFNSYCDLDEAPALRLPVATTRAIPLGLLCIDEKERLPNTQSAQPAPTAHTGLLFSLVPMIDNNRDVTLNDLQTTFLDINHHMLWLYDIMNRGVKEGSATA